MNFREATKLYYGGKVKVKSIKRFFIREKEDNWELEEKLMKKFNTENILYFGAEIEIEVEIFEDGTNKVISLKELMFQIKE